MDRSERNEISMKAIVQVIPKSPQAKDTRTHTGSRQDNCQRILLLFLSTELFLKGVKRKGTAGRMMAPAEWAKKSLKCCLYNH